MPLTLSDVERRQWVHTDVLGFYDGVYYWEYECQHCGALLEAMPAEAEKRPRRTSHDHTTPARSS